MVRCNGDAERLEPMIVAVNPATGERDAEYAPLSSIQLEQRVARGAQASLEWKRTTATDRCAVVRRAAGLLRRDVERHASVITTEMGKLIEAARAEVLKCADTCDWYADHAPGFLAPDPMDAGDERAYVAYEPLGIVLAVMPWNFPFWQVVRFAAPALCAGNVALLKHASNVPGCALALERVFTDAGAPEGVFQTLLVETDAVAGLLADPRIAAATLTGSERAGRAVAEHAGRHLKKVVLELGGSDPFIVLPGTDLDTTVREAVRSRTINAGQSCIAAKRFIAHAELAAEFEQRFAAALSSLRIGSPLDRETEVGPLVSERAVDELHAQVDASVRAGARLVVGGRRLPGPGFYYAPTLLADAPSDTPAYRDELFGPVATLLVARDTDDAIRIANDTRFGLGASVWTRDLALAEQVARQIDAGNLFVNQIVASDPRFPFGGVKSSGYGRELGALGMREFMNIKTVRIRLTSD